MSTSFETTPFWDLIGIDPTTITYKELSPTNQEIEKSLGINSSPWDFFKAVLSGKSSLGAAGSIAGSLGLAALANKMFGEFETAIEILLEATNLFPKEYEIEYRLAGLYFLSNENNKGNFHLNNGLRLNYKNKTVLKDYFPVVWERTEVQNTKSKFKK